MYVRVLNETCAQDQATIVALNIAAELAAKKQ
jgi:hypothetical protein